jgi:hypothetical protein
MECERCGLDDQYVISLDTGAWCHPELIHCIRALRAELDKTNATIKQLTHPHPSDKYPN